MEGQQFMNPKPKILAFLRTILITYVLTGILLFLLAFLLYKFKLKESQITIGVMAIYLLTCMLGGVIAGKTMKSKRMIWGFLLGLIYFLVLLGVSFLMNKGLKQDMQNAITTFLVCVGGSTIGGMLS